MHFTVQFDLDISRAERICCSVYIFDHQSVPDIQPYIPVNASVCQIVDGKSERRYSTVLCRIKLYNNSVLRTIYCSLRKFRTESRIAAAVFT